MARLQRLALALTVLWVMLTAALCSGEGVVKQDYPTIPPSEETSEWTEEDWGDLWDEGVSTAQFNEEYSTLEEQQDAGFIDNNWIRFQGEWFNSYNAWLDAREEGPSAASDESDSTDSTVSTSSTSPSSSDESGAGEAGCEAGESDPRIPSIGRTGSAALNEAMLLGMLDDGETVDSRDLGLAIREQISSGELCADDLILLWEEGVLTDEMAAAIRTGLESLGSG